MIVSHLSRKEFEFLSRLEQINQIGRLKVALICARRIFFCIPGLPA